MATLISHSMKTRLGREVNKGGQGQVAPPGAGRAGASVHVKARVVGRGEKWKTARKIKETM